MQVILQNHSQLTNQQHHITDQVKTQYNDINNDIIEHEVLLGHVDVCIHKLKRNAPPPGVDAITAAYPINGRSAILCEHLSVLSSVMLTHNHVPSIAKATDT